MTPFRFFERMLEPTSAPPEAPPPAGLAAFYWHYARQARGLVVALFFALQKYLVGGLTAGGVKG